MHVFIAVEKNKNCAGVTSFLKTERILGVNLISKVSEQALCYKAFQNIDASYSLSLPSKKFPCVFNIASS